MVTAMAQSFQNFQRSYHPDIETENNLRLRFNHLLNCWQLHNYLRFTNKPREWKWFSVSTEQARLYAKEFHVAISVEETVTSN